MKILIADDDDISRLALEGMLTRRGYQVVPVADGLQALEVLQGKDPPKLAILDWVMPGIDGVEVCRRVRQTPRLRDLHLILLTGREGKDNVVEGLRAGANDYVIKPFDPEELEARVNVSAQVVQLQAELAARVRELEDALSRVKQLQGLLPICSYCKQVRDDHDYWHQVELYVMKHSEARFSHSVCPPCYEKHVKPEMESLERLMRRRKEEA